jgi:dihydroneopterin aldolase
MGRHGVNDFEQERAQPFEVDLDLEVDTRPAAVSDDLARTVSYSDVAKLVVRIIETEQHQLVERLASRIAEDVLALPGVDAVEVALCKLRPPVTVDLATAGVRIRRP